MISKTSREHFLRGFIRLFPLFFLLAITPSLIVPLFGPAPVYNTAQLSPLMPPLLALGIVLLVWTLPSPSSVFFSACLLAGSTANILYSQIAPVPDYIALPWNEEHFLNTADIFLLLALLALPWVIVRLLREYWV